MCLWPKYCGLRTLGQWWNFSRQTKYYKETYAFFLLDGSAIVISKVGLFLEGNEGSDEPVTG